MKKIAKRIIDNPIKIFVLIATIFGMLTIVATPMFTGADEEAHFIRVWGISNGELFLTSKNDNQVNMPKAFRETISCLQNKVATQGSVYEYKYANYGRELSETIRCSLSIKTNNVDTEGVRASSASYSPIAYLPQLAAVYIGRALDLPIIIIGYMVRVSVLVAYIGLVVLAIRLLVNRQWALVGIALLPHSLMQITNPGADYILFGAGAIFVAAIIRSRQLTEAEYKSEKNKLLLIVFAALSLLMVPKGMFPGICFVPLILFMSGIRKEILAKIVIVVCALALGVIWQKISSATLPLTTSPDIASLIGSFPKAFVKTMFHTWANQDFIYKSMGLGLDNRVGLPGFAISLMNMLVAFYIFVAVKSEEKVRSIKYFSLVTWVVVLAIVAGSFAAMHVMAYALQTGDGIINGVQSRYFYPALFILAIIPMRRFIYVKNNKVYRNFVVIGSAAVLIIHTMAIIARYYIYS